VESLREVIIGWIPAFAGMTESVESCGLSNKSAKVQKSQSAKSARVQKVQECLLNLNVQRSTSNAQRRIEEKREN